MFGRKKRRSDNKVSAGSMADIAFLLLIFFLVTTTILTDKGIMVKLPPWDPNNTIIDIPDKNVLNVLVNADNRLLVEGQPAQVEGLRFAVKDFILNPRQETDKPDKPTKAVISLQNDRGTEYNTYITVYNELQAAYNELWEEKARTEYGQSYPDLPDAYRKAIRDQIPMIISEAEPTTHGEGAENGK